MPTYPPDRFDRPPADLQRVGAHRAPRPRRGWITFAWAALTTAVLVGIGVFAMFLINDRVSFTNPFGTGGAQPTVTPEPSAAPTVEPTLDPAVNVVVLNGTTVAGLAGQVGDSLAGQGWSVGSRSNASTQDVAVSAIYYGDPGLEGAARGLSAALGGMPIQLSDQFAVTGESRITVVLGADYGPPA
jgi:LytR cell envelope-related transcriptional attenuator